MGAYETKQYWVVFLATVLLYADIGVLARPEFFFPGHGNLGGNSGGVEISIGHPFTMIGKSGHNAAPGDSVNHSSVAQSPTDQPCSCQNVRKLVINEFIDLCGNKSKAFPACLCSCNFDGIIGAYNDFNKAAVGFLLFVDDVRAGKFGRNLLALTSTFARQLKQQYTQGGEGYIRRSGGSVGDVGDTSAGSTKPSGPTAPAATAGPAALANAGSNAEGGMPGFSSELPTQASQASPAVNTQAFDKFKVMQKAGTELLKYFKDPYKALDNPFARLKDIKLKDIKWGNILPSIAKSTASGWGDFSSAVVDFADKLKEGFKAAWGIYDKTVWLKAIMKMNNKTICYAYCFDNDAVWSGKMSGKECISRCNAAADMLDALGP